tara:strand:- start:377 stop:997 length:621 start_codon:yes stop_codon:yes gene_type:complete
MDKKTLLIGIAGGSASGKSSLARVIKENIGENISIINQDSYYHDLSNISMLERSKTNFDHPDSIDFILMKKQLENIVQGLTVEIPIYDYKSHTRTNKKQKINNQNIIIFEGILTLFDSDVRKLLDIKIFVDTEADLRVIRRIKRDLLKRKRTLDSIITQYHETVRPMYKKFVKPTKSYADIIIPNGSHNNVAIDLILTKIKSYIDN